MKVRLDTVITGTLVLCALVTTGLVVRREFFSPALSPVLREKKPIFIKDWRAILSRGSAIGSADAPVQIIEFGDFECPFCGEFHRTLGSVQREHPNAVTLTFAHFPLPGHRFAAPAARVAQCAGDQSRFEAMHDQLFEHQDDFGLKPWSDFANAAGVPDLGAFDACVKRTDPIPSVEESKALGKKLDIQGTPTIIINGWKLGRPPNADELDGMVRAILAGKTPVTVDGKFAN